MLKEPPPVSKVPLNIPSPQELFCDLWRALSEAAAGCYAACGRRRHASLLRSDVADVLMSRGDPQVGVCCPRLPTLPRPIPLHPPFLCRRSIYLSSSSLLFLPSPSNYRPVSA